MFGCYEAAIHESDHLHEGGDLFSEVIEIVVSSLADEHD